MQKIKHERCSFGEFVLDITRGCLLRGSEEIKLRPKSFEVLKYLVENNGRLVTKSELIATVWPDTFVTDNSLVQCLIEVRRALEDSQQQQIVKTVPRRGYVFVADVREDDPQLGALSASDEIIVLEEPESLDDERPVIPPASPSEPAKSRRVLLLASILCAVVAVTGLTIFSRHRAPGPELSAAPINSLAVMPLKNLTNDPENDYFADGLTESLITSLSKLDGLKVISRGSAFTFKGKNLDPRDVGRQLGVAAVLEGSVKRMEDSVRVTVSLVSTEDGHVLWASEKYERALRDIFALEGEIAGTIAGELRVKLNPEKARALTRQYTTDLDAYDLYLKGRFIWNKRTPDALRKAVDYFEQAKARDPNFALAYAGEADCYVLFPEYRIMPPNEAFSKARATATKALELDDQLAEARASLAYTVAFYDWNWTGAEKEFKEAIALNPNYATAHQWYSEYLLAIGRFDESLSEIKQAETLDPLSLVVKADIAGLYYVTRRYDQAIEVCHKMIEMEPSFAWDYGFLYHSYKEKGLFPQAVAALNQYDQFLGQSRENLEAQRVAYNRSGFKGLVRTRLAQALAKKQGYFQAIEKAMAYVELEEKDKAIASLEEAYAARERWMANLKFTPQWDSLRDDPRFQDLERRVGLSR